MPKKGTYKIKERKHIIIQILGMAKSWLSTSEISDMIDCTISQTFYTLKLLEKEGKVEKKESRGGKQGKRYLWKLK